MRLAFSLVVMVTALSWLIYEVIAWRTPDPNDMISQIVWQMNRYPFFVFAVSFLLGLLCGHFFWQRIPDDVVLKP